MDVVFLSVSAVLLLLSALDVGNLSIVVFSSFTAVVDMFKFVCFVVGVVVGDGVVVIFGNRFSEEVFVLLLLSVKFGILVVVVIVGPFTAMR